MDSGRSNCVTVPNGEARHLGILGYLRLLRFLVWFQGLLQCVLWWSLNGRVASDTWVSCWKRPCRRTMDSWYTWVASHYVQSLPFRSCKRFRIPRRTIDKKLWFMNMCELLFLIPILVSLLNGPAATFWIFSWFLSQHQVINLPQDPRFVCTQLGNKCTRLRTQVQVPWKRWCHRKLLAELRSSGISEWSKWRPEDFAISKITFAWV